MTSSAATVQLDVIGSICSTPENQQSLVSFVKQDGIHRSVSHVQPRHDNYLKVRSRLQTNTATMFSFELITSLHLSSTLVYWLIASQ